MAAVRSRYKAAAALTINTHDGGCAQVAVGSVLGYRLLELSASWQPLPGALRQGTVTAIQNAGASTTDAGVATEDALLTLLEVAGDGGGGEPAEQAQRAWSDLVEPRLLQQAQTAGAQQTTAPAQGKRKRKGRGKPDEAVKLRAGTGHEEPSHHTVAAVKAAPPSSLSSPPASGTVLNSRTPTGSASAGAAARTGSSGRSPSASYRYDRITSISAQLEYYFSAKHLDQDEYLRGLLRSPSDDGVSFVTLETLSTYPKLNKMLQTGVLGNTPLDAMVETMAKAVEQSALLELSGDRQALRPTQPPW